MSKQPLLPVTQPPAIPFIDQSTALPIQKNQPSPFLATSVSPVAFPASASSAASSSSAAASNSVPKSSPGIFALSSHPVALTFHLLFRTLALLTYLFGTLFSSSFIFIFVVTILFLAFDFWTVKNVSGRLLVGLRWWNQVNPDGTSVWIFESRKDGRPQNETDAKLFWYSLYLTTAIWGLFAIVCLIKWSVSWLIVVVVAIMLNMANVVGYTKCSKDARKHLQDTGTNLLAQVFANRLNLFSTST